jgi:hypothetical protein
MPRPKRRRRLGIMERIILESTGVEGLIAWWGERRDDYNAERRRARDLRRRRIAALWDEDETLGTCRLSQIFGVCERVIWRDRAALRAQGIEPVRESVSTHPKASPLWRSFLETQSDSWKAGTVESNRKAAEAWLDRIFPL